MILEMTFSIIDAKWKGYHNGRGSVTTTLSPFITPLTYRKFIILFFGKTQTNCQETKYNIGKALEIDSSISYEKVNNIFYLILFIFFQEKLRKTKRK
jgi:hypothetical protein